MLGTTSKKNWSVATQKCMDICNAVVNELAEREIFLKLSVTPDIHDMTGKQNDLAQFIYQTIKLINCTGHSVLGFHCITPTSFMCKC